MMLGVRIGFVYLLGGAILLTLVTYVVSSSNRFTFRQVMFDGRPVDEQTAAGLGLRTGESLFDQNLELVAEALSRREGIGVASVFRELPDRIVVQTNVHHPRYAVFDSPGKRLLGMTASGLIVPLDSFPEALVGPALLGLSGLAIFEKPGDFRLMRVISALERLRDRSEDWFAGISAVDFTSDSRLVLSFASFEFQALVDPLRIEEALHTLETLTAAHVEKAMSARVVDLRYDGMIVLSYKPGSGASKTSAPKKSGSRKSSSKARKSTRQNSIKTG